MAWDIRQGEVLARRAIHEIHGGSRQNGITRAGQSDDLLLFSSSRSGPRFGYHDGPQPDGTFHYIGEGQVGDQKFIRGNAAIRDHEKRGLHLHLFEEVRRSTVRYEGQFRLSPDRSYYFEEARDRLNDLRKVIVFRLIPVDAATPIDTSPPQQTAPAVRDVPIEARETATFQSEPNRDPTTAERREAALVHRYTASLEAAGAEVSRKEIRLPNVAHAFYTDLFNLTSDELIEAKGSASRFHVRLAIGQLCDYGRYLDHRSRAVLLPSDPGPDLIWLLHGLGITCIYEEDEGSFVRCEPAPQAPSRE